MTAQKDHYKVLGLEKKATEDDVKRAYRSLAKQFHPDKNKNPGAEEKFKEIGAAYDVLKDEQKRRTYDMQRDTEQLRKDNEKASRERAEKAAREAREAAARASTKPTSWQTPPHRTPPHYDHNAFRNSAFFKDTSYEESRTKPPKGPKASTKSQRQYRGSEENKAPKYTFMKDEDASPRGPGAAGRRGTKAGGAGRQRAWQKTSFTTDFNMKPDWDDDFASDPTPSPTSPSPASTPRQTSSRRQKPQKPAGGNTYFHFVDDDLLNAAFEDFADILGEEPAEFVFPAFPSSNPLRHMFTTSNLDFYSNPNASRRQQPGKSKGDLDDDMWDWSKPMFGGSPDPKKAARMYGRRGSGASTPGGEMRCSYCRRPLPAAEVAGHEEICRRFHATPSPSPGGGIRGAAAPRNRAPPPRTRKSVEETSGCSDCQKKYGKNAKFHCSCGAKRAL